MPGDNELLRELLSSVVSETASALANQLNLETEELEQVKRNELSSQVSYLEELAKMFNADTKRRISLEIVLKTIAEQDCRRENEEQCRVQGLSMKSRAKLAKFIEVLAENDDEKEEGRVYRKTPYPSCNNSLLSDDSCDHGTSSCCCSLPCSCTTHNEHHRERAYRHTGGKCRCTGNSAAETTTSDSSVGSSKYSLFDVSPSMFSNDDQLSFLASSSQYEQSTSSVEPVCERSSSTLKTATAETIPASIEKILDKKCRETAEELHAALCSTAIQLHYRPRTYKTVGFTDDDDDEDTPAAEVQQVSSEEVHKCVKYLVSKGFPFLEGLKVKNCNCQHVCAPNN